MFPPRPSGTGPRIRRMIFHRMPPVRRLWSGSRQPPLMALMGRAGVIATARCRGPVASCCPHSTRWDCAGLSGAPDATNSEGPCHQMDRSVFRNRQMCADMLAYSCLAICRQSVQIGRGWTLAAEKRRPEIIEVPEDRRYVKDCALRLFQAASLEQPEKVLRFTNRKTLALIEWPCGGIKSNGR